MRHPKDMQSSTPTITHVQAKLAWAVATHKERSPDEQRELLADLLAEADETRR